jgi:hypothetical protein
VRAAAAEERLAGLLLAPGAGLDDLPAVTLAGAERRVVAHGGWTGRVERLGAAGEGIVEGSAVRLLLPDGSLAAIARVAEGGRLVTDKVLLDRGATERDSGPAADHGLAAPDDGKAAPHGGSTPPGTDTLAPDPGGVLDA